MNDEHYLFVSCPFGGTEVFMKNLRLYVEARNDISSHWLEIPRTVPSNTLGVGHLTNNWTLRASASAFLAIRDLRRRGVTIKAAFFNHLTAVSLLLWYRQIIPCVLSLDITPVLLNLDRDWYIPEGFHTRGLAASLSKRWSRRTYSTMRYLLPWSQYAKDSLVADYGVASDQIIVMPPGLDMSIWKPRNHEKARNGERLSVLFVGGDFIRKGGDVLAQLAATEAFQEFDFHFVTNSFSGPTPKNVHVYSNLQPGCDELVRLYQESDVFVLPTRADYTPNAVVEALAMGLPVITTNVGAVGEMIHDGKEGFIVPPNGGEMLGQRLVQLKSNPALLQELKLNARRHAENSFDIAKIGSRIIDLLREVGEPERKPHVQG